MCRNIKTLHNFRPPATDAEIHASSLQFVRKLSGFTKPSKTNEVVFARAVEEVAEGAHARRRRRRLIARPRRQGPAPDPRPVSRQLPRDPSHRGLHPAGRSTKSVPW